MEMPTAASPERTPP